REAPLRAPDARREGADLRPERRARLRPRRHREAQRDPGGLPDPHENGVSRRGSHPEPPLVRLGHGIASVEGCRSAIRPPSSSGAGMSGLLAARALSGHVARVTLVERDALPERDESRKGVPQSNHAHGLLASGYQAMDDYFPGIMDELGALGAPRGT